MNGSLWFPFLCTTTIDAFACFMDDDDPYPSMLVEGDEKKKDLSWKRTKPSEFRSFAYLTSLFLPLALFEPYIHYLMEGGGRERKIGVKAKKCFLLERNCLQVCVVASSAAKRPQGLSFSLFFRGWCAFFFFLERALPCVYSATGGGKRRGG